MFTHVQENKVDIGYQSQVFKQLDSRIFYIFIRKFDGSSSGGLMAVSQEV